MAYAVQADLNLDTQRLIELTDNSSSPGVIDSTVMTLTEGEAEAIVNAILAGLPGVPFTGTVPAIIRVCAAWIWKKRLYLHRETMETPKNIDEGNAWAIDMLKEIAAGGGAALGLPASSGPGAPDVSSSPPRGWTDRDLVSS